ncbi:predicted protein [Postia placenta Mad-698-R]|nr:predicted protein [Postia placenta Mad-698-R]
MYRPSLLTFTKDGKIGLPALERSSSVIAIGPRLKHRVPAMGYLGRSTASDAGAIVVLVDIYDLNVSTYREQTVVSRTVDQSMGGARGRVEAIGRTARHEPPKDTT